MSTTPSEAHGTTPLVEVSSFETLPDSSLKVNPTSIPSSQLTSTTSSSTTGGWERRGQWSKISERQRSMLLGLRETNLGLQDESGSEPIYVTGLPRETVASLRAEISGRVRDLQRTTGPIGVEVVCVPRTFAGVSFVRGWRITVSRPLRAGERFARWRRPRGSWLKPRITRALRAYRRARGLDPESPDVAIDGSPLEPWQRYRAPADLLLGDDSPLARETDTSDDGTQLENS